MSNQGAIQIDVTINNKSLTITKDHVMSLKVKRVIGDSANEFTLEAFDETAFALESALMQGRAAPISVRYSAAQDMTKSVLFTGTCLNYQLSFVGRAAVISITGILSLSSGDSSSYWFGTQAIEWVGDLEDWASKPDQEAGRHDWHVDGKGWEEIVHYDDPNYENNEDICAIYTFPLDKDGNVNSIATPIVYYNPSRIFKRIIKKYNGEIGQYTSDSAMPSNYVDIVPWTLSNYNAGKFTLGNVDDSRWIEGIRRCQESNETTAQYINNVLCKYAVSDTGVNYQDEIAGFKYYIKDGKHCFTKLNYDKDINKSNTISVSYGTQNSNVISFSLSNIGIVAMTGGVGADGKLIISESTFNDLYTDEIDAKGTKILGVSNDTELSSSDELNKYTNWYFGLVQGVHVSSSSSSTGIDANIADIWKTLSDLPYNAELVIWADYSNIYTPGDYIDLVVIGAGGVRHYSSGIYLIVSISDDISSAGYTQAMKLIKKPTDTKSASEVTNDYSKITLYNYDGMSSEHYSSVHAISNIEQDKPKGTTIAAVASVNNILEQQNKREQYNNELSELNKAEKKEVYNYQNYFYENVHPNGPNGTYTDLQLELYNSKVNEITSKYDSERTKLKAKYGV